ncbi:MAG: tyrosine-protein phosphatase [Bacilli bacterium]|jgi:protein-tyrosine phosphatase
MFLKFDSIENIRDLGGATTKDGRRVKAKLLLRSSDLHRLTPEDLKILKDDYQLKTVVDFRSTKSFKNKPDRIDETVSHHHLYVLHYLENHSYDRNIPVPPDEFFRGIYRSLAVNPEAIEAFRRYFKIILEHDQGSILWHCTSGKDRTGVASALLLYLLGCDMETIYREHLLTNEIMEPLLKQILLDVDPDDEEEINFHEVFYLARKEYLDEYFSAIDREFGSLDRYVAEQLGLGPTEIERLKNRYLEND